MFPKYSHKTIFEKLNKEEQKSIIEGFHSFYMDNADNPLKYSSEDCNKTIESYIEMFGETQLFTDREFTELTRVYMTMATHKKIWSEKYPEWFI